MTFVDLIIFLLTDDTPKPDAVVQKSSSPGLVQPQVPVERLETNTPVTEPSSSVEPEPSFPASLAAPVAVPLTVANTSERPSSRDPTASSSSPGEQKPPLALPQTPNTDRRLSDSSQTVVASPSIAPKALNGLADSRTELDVAGYEPSLFPSDALQPHPPAYKDSSSVTLPSDSRPDVPIAAAPTTVAPVAVVPVTLTSSPAPALPVTLPPGLPPLVQATTEADELSESLDATDLVPRVRTEAHGGITDNKTESQQQALIRTPPTGILSVPFLAILPFYCH